jgi:MFS transporter, PAT family, beta-lactamase induction signal transducer AmpG
VSALPAAPGVPPGWWVRPHRLFAVAVLGFASGLPLALTGQAMQAWLTMDGLRLSDIGFLTLVGLPYTFKFIWAPLMDRFDLAGRWRRRAWLVATQLLLAAALLALAATSPRESMRAFALLAVTVAFLSASQDIVVDAYRTDVLAAAERGLGASLAVMGYRLAMILSGGITLIWTDAQQGGGMAWGDVYRVMAVLMAAAAVVSALLLPSLPALPPAASDAPVRSARQDLIGFVAVVLAVALGAVVTQRLVQPLAEAFITPLLAGTALSPALRTRWADLAALFAGIALTLPLAMWAARRARFHTLQDGLRSYFSQRGAALFLVFIVLYKLGDAFAGSLMTPFLLSGLHYAAAEVGVVNKVLGLWLTIAGALVGGVLMFRLGLWRALLAFGVLQMASNLGFWWLAEGGKGTLGGLMIPAFDWGFVKIVAPTAVDGALLAAVAFENLSGGMGTTAHVAFQMALCQQRFTATQFALLSAFGAIGRVWVGPMAGVLAESIGWPTFFILSTALALPGLWLLWRMRSAVQALDAPPVPASVD